MSPDIIDLPTKRKLDGLTPMFSVVVPVYNKAPHIRRTVLSVLNQSCRDFELIIIDDASTDSSLREIQKFDDPRIRLFHRKTPGPGGYAARNLGIRKARGEWIAFLDADDEWLPPYLENVYKLSQEFPESSFLTCGWRKVNPKGSVLTDNYSIANVTRGPHTISVQEYLALCVERKRPTHTCVACIRNNEFASNLFPHGRASRGGDLYAWISYLVRSRQMAWSPMVGAVYYQNAVNMVTESAPYSIELMRDFIEDFQPCVNRIEMRLLKKFVNRQIFEAWRWHKQRNEEPFSLSQNLQLRGDTFYFLSRSAISLLPSFILRAFFWMKARVRFRSLLPFHNTGQ